VNGECTADYQVKARHSSSRAKMVYKKKDLSLCKDRSETNLGIPVTHYPTEKVCIVKVCASYLFTCSNSVPVGLDSVEAAGNLKHLKNVIYSLNQYWHVSNI
jgi:hypothetical protein